MSKILRIISLLLTCVMFNTGQSTEEFKEDDWRCDDGCAHSLQELPFMISPEDFFSKFVHRHRPVLMRNVPTIWPALEAWSDSYFLRAYNKSTVPVVEGLLDFHKPPSHITIEEFFHRCRLDDLTLVDNIDGHSQLLEDIVVPLCLRCEHLMTDFQVSYWLRNNKQLYRTPLLAGPKEHLIAVVNGSLQVSFMSAKYSAELWSAENPQEALENSHLGPSGNSLPIITTELKEGDVLYIPQMWWRQLTVTGSPSLLVHFEWLSTQWKGMNPPSAHKTSEEVGELNRLSQLLRSYEESFSTSKPVNLQCPQQDRRMSEYVFETGKMDPEDYKRIHDGPDYRDGINELCAFDMNNNKSPCRVKLCMEEPESEQCILYTLDYCFEWEDRGCAEELPNLLNKMDGEMLRGKPPLE